MRVQDVSLQVDIERNPFGYVLQNNAPGLVLAAFPHPFVHQTPIPNQAGAEISGDSLGIICITPMHRLVWSSWKRAPLVDSKW